MHPDAGASPAPAPWFHEDLVRDLSLDTIVAAMEGGDTVVGDAARSALLLATQNDLATVLHRQDVVRDVLSHPEIIRELYRTVLDVLEARRRCFGYRYNSNSSGILYGAVDVLETLLDGIRRLRALVDRDVPFASRGLNGLVATLQAECDDAFLAAMQDQLKRLKFRNGILLSARLGAGNEGERYALRESPDAMRAWIARLRPRRGKGYTFRIADRDEAGARALRDIRNRGVRAAANATAQSADHVTSFFEALRNELAFYIGALNLHTRLEALGVRTVMPIPHSAGSRRWQGDGLYDVGLALHSATRPVGNALRADGKSLVVITGANQGGKSTFLRSLGLAQVMMQAGLFVGADAFEADLVNGLFTHYRREEDDAMTQGRLDEELSRLSGIVDVLRPGSMVLFNESFATTNEREGSEIARQIIMAFVESGITVVTVTHLYDFAHDLFGRGLPWALFLRADRREDATRTFRLVIGEPLETSYGDDLYDAIFRRSGGERDAGPKRRSDSRDVVP